MRKKISTGLIATNGDGKPNIRPPIPASWCHSASATLTDKEIEEVKSASGHNNQLREIMSSENGSGEPSPEDNTPSINGTSNAMSDPDDQTNTHLDNFANGGNNNRVENSESPCVIPPGFDSASQSLPVINNPNPAAMSEDSNVDVETEEQNTPVSNSMQDIERDEAVSNAEAVSSGVDQDRDEQDDDSEMSDAQYIEKQVVESFLNVTPNDLHSIGSKNGTGLPKSSSSASDNSLYKLSARHEKGLSSVGESLDMSVSSVLNKSEKILDAVSMTIASVAAGEGGPPEFLSKAPPDRHRDERVTFQHNQSSVSKHNFPLLSAEKIKHEKSMSASARLPVISSLLAPSSSASHTATLPGIHHIASRGKISSSPTTVLPSVAHFLGPAKSPPIAYTSRQSSTDVYGTPLTATSGDTNDSVHLSSHYQTSTGSHLPTDTTHSSSKSKSSRKPVTPAGLRLSMAASEELPDPLPVPQYSDKVIRAKQLGTVAFDRPTVLRETVQFFLQFKHYWSSHDYDRISNLVIELFPEFKDNSDTPGVPANKRIRTDLSMYARNFRRREVSQRKKEGSGFTPNSMDQRSETATSGSQEGGGRQFYSPSSPSNSNGGSVTTNSTNNPSDFCNELLTAASIIESQNTASRNREMSGQGPHNHHKIRIAEPGSHSQGVAIQKQETVEDDDARRDAYSSQQKSRGETADDEEDDTPIHFVYDKDAMTASRDATAAWQMYSEQMAQTVAAGSSGLDYGVSEVYQVEPYTQQAVKKDLGTCARNMRRRLPSAKYKPIPSSQKSWGNSHMGLEPQISDSTSVSAAVMPGTAEYMKALMAAQNMNLTELGMTQRNLGELALLAGIKQRIEQYPQEVTDLERQYLAQCSSEEQRQALMASGAFGNDTSAMAALSAFYGLGMDITSTKRGPNSSDYSTAPTHDTSSSMAGGELDIPSKRQRRISQAEVEKRLREAELNHSSSHHEDKSHGLSVGVSDTHLVKREPMSPSGEGGKASSKHHHQHLSVPISAFPSTSSSSTHDPSYWDTQAAPNMALASLAHPGPQQAAAQAHSQAQIQHLTGHDPSAHPGSTEAPMNLTYHESEKHVSHRLNTDSPLPDSLPDTAGLAAQVEVTTSSVKSQSPRRRASSSPRSSHQGDQSLSSRDQVKLVWFPHGAGFKKENQEIVCLPDPLPIPNYSQKILSARAEGSSMRHRSEIIRETARFFLGHKYWWSSADYTRISELVVQQFPDLKDDSSPDGMTNYRRIQRDLSMCARNLRRSKKPRKMRELSTDPSNSLLDPSGTPRSSKKQSKLPKSSLFSSSLEKRQKRSSGHPSKIKKLKQESAATVVSEPSAPAGASEDMTAAAALLQQQFMQSSSASSYHPSAHLLPSSHMLPSLHTHPSLHEQQMQLSSALLHQQLQESHVSVEEAHSAKRLVKEESGLHEAMEHSFTGVKSGTVTPMQRAASPTTEGQASLSKSNIGHIRSLDGVGMNKEEHEKIVQHQPTPPTTMKVYADPDHGNDLQEKFSTLWRKGKFFDASLGVTNKKLHVHKLVLLAMSPYLQETFKNADPRSQLEVNLPSDTTYETAKAFLKYIYEGILEVDTSSVRSLHKIATMLQMTKLAQYCQNFAQQLQEEADQANGVRGGGEGEIPKISVNLGELADVQAQRQRHLEAQALHRLGETSSMSSSDLHRSSAARYMSEEHAQLKGEYLTTGDQTSADQMSGAPHFLHQDVLSQHRALVAASSSLQSSNPSSLLLSSSQDVATQQLIQAALARHQASSSPQPPQSVSSSMYQQHQQHVIAQNDAALLHRLTSADTSVTASSASHLDHQQKLAFAAYWQAHTIGELMSRNQVTGLTSDPSSLTAASELAAIAAAAASTTSEDTRHLLSSIGHENKLKTSHSRGHHSKQTSWSSQVGDTEGGHQGTMLPETCMPADMARSHVNNTGGNS
ncbi:unnamed protein product [Candidula unifasciata]|uniref:BTB domain-containing protein n=1 Tax=Candidula unifasciata TaxID=100452 RepID=A0A8S3ZHQ1_9EUPU|nr:unnamed protein product [Candidula unifasciata]